MISLNTSLIRLRQDASNLSPGASRSQPARPSAKVANRTASREVRVPAVMVNPAPPQAGNEKTLCHTPFGDVMADTASAPNPAAAFTYKSAAVGNAAVAPASPIALQTPPAAPTLESEFGSQPYLNKPTGLSPVGSYDFNPIYFATRQTAEKIASLVGGTVVERNDMIAGGPFRQDQPNEMIQFSDGHQVNAGLIANFFNHGYPQSYIDSLLQKVSQGIDA